MLSIRLWRVLVRNLFRRNPLLSFKKQRNPRLSFEQLEDRVVPATDTWTAAGSGDWDVGSNWSTGSVPGSSDAVIIDTTATATITIQSGDNINVQSVNVESSADTLSITGGALEVTAGASVLSGPLTMTGGTLEANGSGASFTANGTTSVDDASLYAEGGATLSLPELTSTITWGTFQAEGTDTITGQVSLLSLPALTKVTQGNGGWTINALSGGEVDLNSLATLSAQTGINDTGGSTIVDPDLTSLNDVGVTLDGTDPNVANTWTTFDSGSITVEDGGSYTLPNVTTVFQSNLYAESGGQLTLPKLTSTITWGTFQAEGTDTITGQVSLLSLPALTKVTQGNGGWTINALSGGEVDLNSLATLSAQTGINDTGGSTIVDPDLTSLNDVGVTLDGTDPNVANTWTTFDSGSITVEDGGSYTLPNVTTVFQSNLYAESGGQLTLPKLTSTITWGTFQAEGTDTITGQVSLLSLPALTKVTQGNGGWTINALSGGEVDLNSLATLSAQTGINDTGGSTIVDPDLTSLNDVGVTLDGTDPNVANTWTTFDSGSITVEDGGSYTLPNVTTVFQSNLYAESGGQLTLPKLTSTITWGTFQAEGTDTITGQVSLLSLPALTKVTQGNGGWTINALSGGEVDLNSLATLSAQTGINDTGGSTIVDPDLTSLNDVGVTLDGTDPNVANTWTTFDSGSITVEDGGSYTLPNVTTVFQSNLYAESGGQLTLPKLTSTITWGTFQAEGTDTITGQVSLLSLPALTKVTQGNGGWTINALSGGEVDLNSLATLSAQTGINDTGGSTIVDPDLTSLNDVGVTLDGTDPNVANTWTTFDSGSITVEDGGSYTLPNVTTVFQSNLYAESGGQLTLPKLTSTITWGTFQAEGTDTITGQVSLLSLPALTKVTQGNGGWTINALSGGEVDLNSLATLSAQTGINDTGGSTIVDPDLTSLNDVGVTLDGTDPNVANTWTTFDSGSITVEDGGSYTLPNVTTVFQSNLYAESGGQLTLPKLTSIATWGTFQAEGVDNYTGQASLLDLSALTNVTQGNGSWTVNALSGGEVDLPVLASLTSTAGISITDTGGSTLNDPKLASLSGVNVSTDGTDTSLFSAWTSFTNGTLSISGNDVTLPALIDMASATLDFGGGASLNLPVLTQGNIDVPNSSSVTIQGILMAVPASGSTGAIITMPASQGLSITIDNTGSLSNTLFDIGAGTELVLAGGSYLGGNTFDFGNGASVDLTGGQTTTYGGTLTGTGNGTVDLANGDLDVGTGGLTLDFPGNMFQWTGSAFFASLGDVTNNGTINLGGSNDKGIFEDSTFYNYGTMIQTGTGNLDLHSDSVSPTTFVNEPGGVYNIESDSGIDNVDGGTTAVDNEGLIEKTGGTGTSQLYINGALDNTGTIEATTGVIYIDPNSFTQVVDGVLTGGVWTSIDGASLEFPYYNGIKTNDADISISGSGAELEGLSGMTANSGTLTIGNGGSVSVGGSFSTSSSSVGGSFSTSSSSSSVKINGSVKNSGSFKNSGQLTIDGTFSDSGSFKNSGQLTIGGTLKVRKEFSFGPPPFSYGTGSFTQTAGGTLTEQIGGATTASYGQMVVYGAATLAGTYAVTQTNGYVPATGQTFPVITFASETGDFSTYKLGPDFSESLTATGLTLDSLVQSSTNLALTSATAPTSAISGQTITVNWSAQNDSANAADGSWQDSVYLSPTDSITSSSTLLGSVEHTGGLAANGTYSTSWTGALPAVSPGNYYVLVETDSLYQLNDSNRANGTMAATTGQLAVSVPALTLGTPSSGSFTAADEDQYYQVTVPAGGSLQIALASAASSGATALYVSQGVEPTPYNAQYSADAANQPNQTLTVPQVAETTTYYILARSVAGSAATADFTLTARQADAVSVTSISSYTGGNAGNVTVEIDGTNFTPQTTATLTLGGTVLDATAVYYESASQIYATFNLTGAAVGEYTLAAQQSGTAAAAPTQFQVIAAKPNDDEVWITLGDAPEIRAGRTGTFVITYTNKSDEDMTAPLLSISTTNQYIGFSTPDDPNEYVSSAELLAVADSGPAGILRPGQSGQLTLTLISDGPGKNKVPLTVQEVAPQDVIQWSGEEASEMPAGMPAAAWSVIWGNLMNVVGTNMGQYETALAAAATYLGNLGEQTSQISDVATLWSFLEEQADALYPAAALTSVVDASLPTPGSLSLSIDRTFEDSISGRDTPGIFGLGWTTDWQTSLSVDPNSGSVFISSGGGYTTFIAMPNGTYDDVDGETGVLTLSAGNVYTYTAADGTAYVFQGNGLLNYEQDPNGNRITVGYNSSSLPVSLTYSNPGDPTETTEQITLTYNGQGFVSQVADGTGDVWDYTYDSAGHLLSVTAPGNLTTTYAYDTGSDAETANALLSITEPGGAQQLFTYDSGTGMLASASGTGGADAIAYTYPGEGEVTATDAAGDQTTVWFNDQGTASRVQSPLGGVSAYTYDINGNLTGYTNAAGQTYQYTYDANGDVTSVTNPLGQTTLMSYGPMSELTSTTDAGGNTTSYSYSSSGNVMDITYPGGTQESFTYDPLGNLTQTVQATGSPIGYTYNAAGQLASESFADGTSEAFTYDSHGNLLTAETFNASNTSTGTTTFTYDADNQVLTADYPDGLTLAFTYNAAGQRSQSVDQSGYTVNYTYNNLGQLTELTDGNNNLIEQYTYNNVGELVKKVNGNGTYTTYAYDADGNMIGEVDYANSTGTAVNSSFTYTYNLLDEMTSMTDMNGNTTTYTYDPTGELTGVALPGGGTITYVYNATGDQTEVIDNGQTTTDASNSDNEITSVGTAAYTYDANGNLATVTDASGTTTYTYNQLNELVSITTPGGATQSFQYSPLGFMTGESSTASDGATTETEYLVDPTGYDNVVGAYTSSGSLIADYTYGLGLASTTGPSGTGYYDFDASGNTIGITGSAGTYVNQYSYQPFGQTTESTSPSTSLPNPFTFAGEVGQMQLSSDLFYMRARDYSSTTDQFQSDDPLGFVGGSVNIRQYVNNDPVDYVDPTGMYTFSVSGTISGGGGLGSGISGSLVWDGSSLLPDVQVTALVGAEGGIGLGVSGSVAVTNARSNSDLTGLGAQYGGSGGEGIVLGGDYIQGSNYNGWSVGAGVGAGTPVEGHGYVTNTWSLNQAAANAAQTTVSIFKKPQPSVILKGYVSTTVHPQWICTNEKPQGDTGPSFNCESDTCGGGSDCSTGSSTASHDPNALVGPAGLFVSSGSLSYALDFENDGGVAAQTVAATEQLDSNLDWSTFQFGSFSFGPIVVNVPAGLTDYQTTVSYQNIDGTPLNVLVDLEFDVATGLLTATFTSIDPTTGQAPSGATDGFLYPDNSTGVGEGYIQYTVDPKAGLTQGTAISGQGSVVFDTNPAISTNTVSNEVDVTPPTSSVAALPASSNPSFTVSWGGDDSYGPGIAYYSVYVSVDGGAYAPWQKFTTATSATYTGAAGNTYSFYSIAYDDAGLIEAAPAEAQATTAVPGTAVPANSLVTLSASTIQFGGAATITLQARDANDVDEPTGGLTVDFSLGSGTTAQGTLSSVTDNGNGTYTATFTDKTDGTVAIDVSIDGSPVTLLVAPPSLTVIGDAASTSKSKVTLSPTSVASGSTTTVTLQVEDSKGDKETVGGLTVTFALANKKTGGQGTFGPVTDNGNGTYTATFTGTLAGSNTITATIDGKKLTKTATIKVTAGAYDLATSVVTVSAASVKAGKKITVTLKPEDAAGNKVIQSGLDVVFGLGSGAGSGTFSKVTYHPSTGTYTATFTDTTAGGNNITATIGEQAVTSPSPIVTVTPGAASAKTSTLSLPQGNTVTVGQTITVLLQAVDLYGNLDTMSGAVVGFERAPIAGSKGKGTFGKVTYMGDGMYEATFKGTVAGTVGVTATIGGVKLKATPLSVTVSS